MPFLQLGTGGDAVLVDTTEASQSTPIRLGQSTISAANTIRSTVQAASARRSWKITTVPLWSADRAELLAAAPDGEFVLASGDAIGVAEGGSILCEVLYTDVSFFHVGNGFALAAAFTLTEVAPSGVTGPTGGTPT